MATRRNNTRLTAGLLAAAALPMSPAMADEFARVVSSTPVMQQVAVPQQVCSERPVAVAPARSGGGAVMGAIAGAAIGNAIGGGMGRAAATLLGGLGGAVVGDQIEGRGVAQVQNVTECSTQTVYENRPVAWNVVYEYGGRQYQTQMAQDPGPTLRLQVSPVGAAPAAEASPGSVYGQANGQAYGQAYSQPVYTAPQPVQPVYANPAPVYSAPAYPQPVYVQPAPVAVVEPASYIAPVAISLGLGYVIGRSVHHHGHGWVEGGYRGRWR